MEWVFDTKLHAFCIIIILLHSYLPVRAILYGGKLLFRAPRAKPAPNAMQIAPTTANPIYSGQSEPEQTQQNHQFHNGLNKKRTIYPKTNNEHGTQVNTANRRMKRNMKRERERKKMLNKNSD